MPEDTSGDDAHDSEASAAEHEAAAGRPADAAAGSEGGADRPADADGGAGPGVADGEPGAAGRGSGDRAGRAQAPRKNSRPAKKRSLWSELPVLVLVALIIALLIKTFVIQAFFIPSASMENTLEIGDKILVNKVVYDVRSIQPGDVIVFDGTGSWDPVSAAPKPSSDPMVHAYQATIGRLFNAFRGLLGTAPGQTDYIKRVIGVPGDKVVCCNAQGLVTVNGVPLHEQSYLFPGETPGEAPAGYSGRFSITVPPGRLWVMGDNRAVSDDSRLRQNGPGHGTIPQSAVIGRAFIIVWPPSRWRILPIPSTFLQPGISAPAPAGGAAAVPGTVRAEPTAPYLPLAGGFAGAIPLTWLQRVARRRVSRRRRRRRPSPSQD